MLSKQAEADIKFDYSVRPVGFDGFLFFSPLSLVVKYSSTPLQNTSPLAKVSIAISKILEKLPVSFIPLNTDICWWLC